MPDPHLSWTSTAFGQKQNSTTYFVSGECAVALSDLMEDDVSLALATEASSHPSGLLAMFAQPYVYTGGGLGNYHECPLQTCLAGSFSMSIASVCIPFECAAEDIHASDYLASLELITSGKGSIAGEYFRLQKEIGELNGFLDTGWTCGNYTVPILRGWLISYLVLAVSLILLAIRGTRRAQQWRQSIAQDNDELSTDSESEEDFVEETKERFELAFESERDFEEEKKEIFEPVCNEANSQMRRKQKIDEEDKKEDEEVAFARIILRAWNIGEHYSTIWIQRKDTACLDGIRVGSILWIILGHLLAIRASSGAGYSNAADILPPDGFTSTLGGQLLFASRFAVDTFLVISGYLVVRVLCKIPMSIPTTAAKPAWFVLTYCKTIPGLLLSRIMRILPVYAITLGFFILVAPHLGGGPFWYQWQGLLLPCVKYGWANFLFVNNFFPMDHSFTETCFYHSWYLAVDVQLFILAPLLVFCYRQSQRRGVFLTALLTLIIIVFTIYLTFTRKWSMNTYDGAAVVRFGKEAYTKPHIRAQSYLLGMLLAMCLPQRRTIISWKQKTAMTLVLVTLFSVTFITATGAYSRRACEIHETPFARDASCGSTWSPQMTFLYTATSPSLWSLSVSVLLGLCLNGHAGIIGNILEWKIWTPLSHLTFGAYLIHPIVILVHQLADTQKEDFSVYGTLMDYISVSVVSFAAALVLALLVEMPCAYLMKVYMSRDALTRSREEASTPEQGQMNEDSVDRQSLPLIEKERDENIHVNKIQRQYGSTQRHRQIRI